jgi:hypothetical protein
MYLKEDGSIAKFYDLRRLSDVTFALVTKVT